MLRSFVVLSLLASAAHAQEPGGGLVTIPRSLPSDRLDTLLADVADIMATRTRGEWLDTLSEAGIPCSPVHNMHEMDGHEQTAAIGMIQSSPGLDVRSIGLPINIDGHRPPLTRAAPKLGEHNAEIIGDALD